MEPYNYTSSSSSLIHKPRVVIIGAGLCGISAAHHLFTMSPPNSFQLTILEASARVGGRILTSTFEGQRVEMGATWIHGIEGSPIHGIAKRVGSMQGHDTMHAHDNDDHVGVHEGEMNNNRMSMPWEGMDGLLCDEPGVVSHGGVQVAPSLVRSVGHLYQNLLSIIQHTHGGGLQQFLNLGTHSSLISPLTFTQLKEKLILELKDEASVGAYLQQGLQLYLSSKKEESKDVAHCNSTTSWTTENENLAIGVFRMRGHIERSITGADSLHHLSLAANEEYWEYPGEHLTIPKGYSSVVDSLAAELPGGTIQFNKKVKRIDWLTSCHPSHVVLVHCEDGSLVEADHVIVTVSLGVLKAEALTTNEDKNVDEHKSLFQPPLPQWKQSAISKLGFGLVDKCFLAMKKPPNSIYPHRQFIFDEKEGNPTEGTNTSIPMWMRRNFSFYPIHKTSNVLCMWLIGRDALEVESSNDEEVIDGVMKTMESFGYREEKVITSNNEHDAYTNREPPQVEEILREKWGSNPLFRGSYSYVAIGSTGNDIDTLSEPLPRLSGGSCVDICTGITSHIPRPLQLLFGGEATHRQCYSTTHGAFLSGVREAQRLMKHYGLLKGT